MDSTNLMVLFVFCILIIVIFIQYKKISKINKIYALSNQETTATMIDFENEIEKKAILIDKKEEFISNQSNQMQIIKRKYEDEIRDLKSYYKGIEGQLRNFGEINTHNILVDLKTELVESDVIKPNQMHIMSNIFVPFRDKKGELASRQIDHLLLMSSGAFAIESKYWQGNIMYGVSKSKEKEFGFILEKLYPKNKMDDESTIIFTENFGTNLEKDNKSIESLNVLSYGDPSGQVKSAAATLSSLFKGHGEKAWVTPVIFFNNKNKKFKNYSSSKEPVVILDEKSLREFLIDKIKNKNEFSEEQLKRMEKIVKDVNYLNN